MNLEEMNNYFRGFKDGTKFEYGISEPFSWRGSYDEVAFEILREEMTKEEIIKRIELAYAETFHGHKGGEYTFKDYTSVNFETDTSSYTDGGYTANMIAELEKKEPVYDNDHRLLELAFTPIN